MGGSGDFYYPVIDSTNTRAKQLAEEDTLPERSWSPDSRMQAEAEEEEALSPRRAGIFMTLMLKPELSLVNAPMLTLVAALAVATGFGRFVIWKAKIKWPNDIVVNGKKICGILTEMSTEIDYINHVVIGVGINVNQDTFPDDIKETASSLKMELGKRIKRSG